MKNKIPILLYHDLESSDCINEKKGAASIDTVVHVKEFKKQMKFLSDSGYSTLTLKKYLRLRSEKKTITANKIIITFDDGHFSNYKLAFPILKKYHFQASFFIVGNRVDTKHHMTGEQIIELADFGMEIGSHGFTHKFLPQMEPDDIRKELMESKEILSSLVKYPIEHFAFPGGHYNPDVLKLLPQCGYQSACSCFQGLNTDKTNPFLLKRIEIRKKSRIHNFKNIFDPVQILMYQSVDMVKLILRRMLGLDTYTRLRNKMYKFYIFLR